MADSQAYSWMEGQLVFFTGIGAASAVVAYAQNNSLNIQYGWVNREQMSGGYYDVLTGQRADLNVGAVMCFDGAIRRLFEAKTAVHMKFINSSVAGTAGYNLYSGRIDTLNFNGTENAPYTFTLAAHFNSFSGF
jgi:hypothetical protein